MSLIKDLLEKIPANSVGVDAKNLHSAKTNTKVPQAFATITENKIHALPIQQENGTKYIGFVDLADIVAHLFSSFTDEELKHTNIPKITEWNGEFIRVVEKKQSYLDDEPEIPDTKKIQYFASKTVSEISNTPWTSLSEKKSLYDVLTVLSTKDKVIHRLALHGNQEDSLVKIISQTNVLEIINENIDKLGSIGTLTIEQLKLHQLHNSVIKINKKQVALEGFKLMNANHVTGIAVVDDEDHVVGNLSMSDLKLIFANANELLHLYLSVSEYLKKVHQRDTELPNKDISCSSKTTFANLLKSFVNNHVHRVFVVDDHHKLIDVISITDVLKIIHDSNL